MNLDTLYQINYVMFVQYYVAKIDTVWLVIDTAFMWCEIVYKFQRKPLNPPGSKKGGTSKKDSKNDSSSKAGEESSTDLAAAAVGGLSLEEQPKV